jgi:drug/metabolite transporter (DMT)-like permease
MWIALSLLGAFGQALGWALKKKTLESKRVNNTLGLVSYTIAGLLLFFLWGIQSNFVIPAITSKFIFAALVVSLLNVLAAWAAYKALDQMGLSKLMPYIALTSLMIIPIEYVLRGVLPSNFQIMGMLLVVVGAIIFGAKEKLTKEALPAIKYFGITLICYSITSPFMAVMVDESSSGLFSGTVAHLGIALGFLFLVIFTNEIKSVKTLVNDGTWNKTLFFMLIAGAVIALLENGPINVALETANASEVFALKRTMPFFALILGVMMFKETITKRHILGAVFLVFGSMIVVWFR